MPLCGNHSAANPRWLLIKRQDAYADPDWDIDRHERSVLTGRNL
jgi:hypothetical protein